MTTPVLQSFFYQIPHDTFYDEKDGNTRNLTLSLHTLDNVEPTPDFWTQLTEEQNIVIFPTFGDLGLNFFQGAVARMPFQVFVLSLIFSSSTNLISQSFNVDFNDVNADAQTKLRLIRGVTTSTNIDPSVMQVGSIDPGSFILSWFMTNVAKREHCQTLFNVYKSMFTETKVQPSFARELDEFMLEIKAKFGLTLKGVCSGSDGGPATLSIVDLTTTDGPMSRKKSYIDYVVPAVVAAVLFGLTVLILYRKRRCTQLDVQSSFERRLVSNKVAAKNDFGTKPAQIVEKSVLQPPSCGSGGGAQERVNSAEEDGTEISTRSADGTARWSSSPYRQPPPPPVKESSTSLEAN